MTEHWQPGEWQSETFARIEALGYVTIILDLGVWKLGKADGTTAGPFHTNQELMTWLSSQDGGHSRTPF